MIWRVCIWPLNVASEQQLPIAARNVAYNELFSSILALSVFQTDWWNEISSMDFHFPWQKPKLGWLFFQKYDWKKQHRLFSASWDASVMHFCIPGEEREGRVSALQRMPSGGILRVLSRRAEKLLPIAVLTFQRGEKGTVGRKMRGVGYFWLSLQKCTEAQNSLTCRGSCRK